jgi:hypothetical protein
MEMKVVKVKKSDVLLIPLREKVWKALAESIEEHGVLVPPLLLELDEALKTAIKTEKLYVCIDGYSRFMCVDEDTEVKCEAITFEELKERLGAELSLNPIETVKLYSLRLQALRQPLPKAAYRKMAEELEGVGCSLRQIARLLGLPRSTLHRWMRQSSAPISIPSQICYFCGAEDANRIYICDACLSKILKILHKTPPEKTNDIMFQNTKLEESQKPRQSEPAKMASPLKNNFKEGPTTLREVATVIRGLGSDGDSIKVEVTCGGSRKLDFRELFISTTNWMKWLKYKTKLYKDCDKLTFTFFKEMSKDPILLINYDRGADSWSLKLYNGVI